jgi:beta-glucosidase
MLLGNYNGIPADPVTPLRGIREALPNARVLHSVGSDLADGFPVMHTVPAGPALVAPDGRPGLRMELFNDRALQGTPVFTGTVPNLDVNWDYASPRPGMNPDTFGVRWTGELRPGHTGTYRLGLIGTVKYRLFLNDSLLFESVYPTHAGEFPDPRPTYTRPMQLEAGKGYRVRIEGDESYGTATLRFLWSAPHEALLQEAVQTASQADAVLLFLGLTARMEGEEMRVEIPGFRGGDRTSIDLPATQQQLLEQVVAVGKPTVLVLLNGSALAVNWAQERVPAIVEAWYPGQAAGQAIADVLFGDYNPAGRLPVTFYRSAADLPPFEDYAMKGRTYRYFTGTPLYPFGHGLSYTTFRYANLATSAATLPADGQVTVRVDVTNAGPRAGDEVVQLYVAYPDAAVERPIKDLRGYQRINLQPGQTRTVEFVLAAKDLAYWDPDGDRWVVDARPVRLEVGASSADIRLRHMLPVTSR